MVVTVALAVMVDAQSAPLAADVEGVASGPVSPAPHAAPVTLPPVTEHAIDPEVLAAVASMPSPGGGQSMVQVIELTVIGGDLDLVTDHATVTLERDPTSDRDWIGTLPPVRVVDARGTHEGWTVSWTTVGVDVQGASKASHVPDAKVHLVPGEPAVVAGLPDGLAAGKPGPAVQSGRALFSAAAGSGGGTYEAGGTVALRLPASLDASAVVVELAFSLG